MGVATLFLAATAVTEEVTDRDRFLLWNDCEPAVLVVEDLSNDAADIGLTRNAIEVAARSRLRAARLYDADKPTFLTVTVTVVGAAFTVIVAYWKELRDSASGEIGYARTWYRGGAGTHGRDAGYILSSVSQHTDEFIDEYLRVNEEACSRSP